MLQELLRRADGGAILSYSAKTRKLTDWLPADPKAQAKVNFWMHWTHTGMRKSTIDA